MSEQFQIIEENLKKNKLERSDKESESITEHLEIMIDLMVISIVKSRLWVKTIKFKARRETECDININISPSSASIYLQTRLHSTIWIAHIIRSPRPRARQRANEHRLDEKISHAQKVFSIAHAGRPNDGHGEFVHDRREKR